MMRCGSNSGTGQKDTIESIAIFDVLLKEEAQYENKTDFFNNFARCSSFN